MTRLSYVEAFGNDDRRETRIRILLSLLEIDGAQMLTLVDAWPERRQNPDREPGVGPLVLAFYLYRRAKGGALTAFVLQSHPLHVESRNDTVAPEYMTVYLSAPANLASNMLHTLAAAAVEQVDTDARWSAALGRR